MKYWNKSKNKRDHWTVTIVHTRHVTAKRWCQNHPSKAKFYAGPYSNTWYFEDANDALTFKLIWDRRYE